MDTEISQIVSSRTGKHFRKWLTVLGPFLGLAVVIGIFAVITGSPEKFLSPSNIRIVLSQTVIVAISAIGMSLIIIAGGIDLSVGSTIALSGVVTALTINAGMDPILAVVTGMIVGGVVGVINGAIITGFRVVPFMATLGMLGIARGAAKWVANEQTVNVPATWINDLLGTFPRQAWLLVPPGVWVTLLLALVAAAVLRQTVFGRRIFALGSN